MFEALKIFILTLYFLFIYLLADSFLMALITIPIFCYLEIIQPQFKNIKKTVVISFVGFLIPAGIYFYFSFLPGRDDPNMPLAKLILFSLLFGVLGSFLVLLKRLGDYLQGSYPKLSKLKKHRETLSLLAIMALLPFLTWAHMQYKVSQEKSYDKHAEALLGLLQSSQQNMQIESSSYQKDLATLGFTATTDRYTIYLDNARIPPDYVDIINSETKPYVKSDSYRALLALKNPYSHTIKFFIGNDQGEIKQLKKQLPLHR